MTQKQKVSEELLSGIQKSASSVISHRGAVLERENLIALSYAYSAINGSKCDDDCIYNPNKSIKKYIK